MKNKQYKNICFLINKYRYVIIIHIVKICKYDVAKLKCTFSAAKICTVELKSSSIRIYLHNLKNCGNRMSKIGSKCRKIPLE